MLRDSRHMFFLVSSQLGFHQIFHFDLLSTDLSWQERSGNNLTRPVGIALQKVICSFLLGYFLSRSERGDSP